MVIKAMLLDTGSLLITKHEENAGVPSNSAWSTNVTYTLSVVIKSGSQGSLGWPQLPV